jgi:hypothetical protein
MAAKKTSARKATGKKMAGAKASASTRTAGLTAVDIRVLGQLPASYARRVDQPVQDVVQEGKDLSAALLTYGKRLVAEGGLPKTRAKDLAVSTARLERAERAWTNTRDFAPKGGVALLRKSCTKEKRLAFAALRHFLRDDAEVQARLNNIAVGRSDIDTADDLTKLADLLQANLASVTTPSITGATPEKLRTLSARLSATRAERRTETGPSEAIALRNRAFWQQRGVVREIQSAARFVYRDDPAALKHFRTLRTRK